MNQFCKARKVNQKKLSKTFKLMLFRALGTSNFAYFLVIFALQSVVLFHGGKNYPQNTELVPLGTSAFSLQHPPTRRVLQMMCSTNLVTYPPPNILGCFDQLPVDCGLCSGPLRTKRFLILILNFELLINTLYS